VWGEDTRTEPESFGVATKVVRDALDSLPADGLGANGNHNGVHELAILSGGVARAFRLGVLQDQVLYQSNPALHHHRPHAMLPVQRLQYRSHREHVAGVHLSRHELDPVRCPQRREPP